MFCLTHRPWLEMVGTQELLKEATKQDKMLISLCANVKESLWCKFTEIFIIWFSHTSGGCTMSNRRCRMWPTIALGFGGPEMPVSSGGSQAPIMFWKNLTLEIYNRLYTWLSAKAASGQLQWCHLVFSEQWEQYWSSDISLCSSLPYLCHSSKCIVFLESLFKTSTKIVISDTYSIFIEVSLIKEL